MENMSLALGVSMPQNKNGFIFYTHPVTTMRLMLNMSDPKVQQLCQQAWDKDGHVFPGMQMKPNKDKPESIIRDDTRIDGANT